MEHSHCRDLLDSLSDYIDGALEIELCAEIERHMEGCENCCIVVDSLRKTVTLYHQAAEPPSMPEEVRQRLFHCLALDDFLAQANENGANQA